MKKTIFVIGAGAGYDINMPLGNELLESIKYLVGSTDSSHIEGFYRDTFEEALPLIEEYIDMSAIPRARRAIYEGLFLAKSIDNFIHSQERDRQIERVSKLAIVHSILHSESRCKLANHVSSDGLFEAVDSTWLKRLYQTLTADQPFDGLRGRFEQIAIVNFNYDRCIEYYIFQALQSSYRKPDQETAELIKSLRIYHPYGQVGFLSWQQGDLFARFGQHEDPNLLAHLSKNIKTFNEVINKDDEEYCSLVRAMRQAQHVVFLGFHYHKQNLKLLGYDGETVKSGEDRTHFGTALGISTPNVEMIVDELNKVKFSNAKVSSYLRDDLDCNGLLNEYSWHLE